MATAARSTNGTFLSILEQDARFETYYSMAKKKPRKTAALTILAVEDMQDKLATHCATPAGTAHPKAKVRKVRRVALTPSEAFQLKVMENRGKVIAVIGGVITTALLAVIAYIQGVL